MWLWESEEGPEAGVVMGRLPLQHPQAHLYIPQGTEAPKFYPRLMRWGRGSEPSPQASGLQSSALWLGGGGPAWCPGGSKKEGSPILCPPPPALDSNCWEPCSEPLRASGALVSTGSPLGPWPQRTCHELPEARWPSWTLSLQAGSTSVHPYHTVIPTPSRGPGTQTVLSMCRVHG